MRYRLASGAEAPATNLQQQKEQVRYILREGQNTARLRKAPSQAPVAEAPGRAYFITPACRFTSTPPFHSSHRGAWMATSCSRVEAEGGRQSEGSHLMANAN